MGWSDKIHNTTSKLQGKGKEAAGAAMGNDKLKAQGKTQQLRADLKQAGEKIKGTFKKH